MTRLGARARRAHEANIPLRVAHIATVDLTVRFLLLPQLTRLKQEGYEVYAISAGGPWVADIEAAGIRHIAWTEATRAWNLGKDFAAYRELSRIIRRGNFDIVHTHNPKPGIMGRIAARLAGVPIVVNTVHGYYATPQDRARKRLPVLAAEWLAARFSDFELFQSQEDLSWARRIGLAKAGKSALLGNGTDIERFDMDRYTPERLATLRAELGLPADGLVIGTVGRLVAEKGYRELFAASRSIAAERGASHVHLLVAGESDTEKADAITPNEIDAAERDGVVFTGWKPDVENVMAVMDVFVLASWREGVPRSAIEAASMGKPLVLTDIRGCREVIRDGVEGLLVPARDADALKRAIERMLDDPSMRQRMGKAARERAVDSFDETRVAAMVASTYAMLATEDSLTARYDDMKIRHSQDGWLIRPASHADIADICRLHREALPTGFLPSLGMGFLGQLYRSLMHDPNGIVVVAQDRTGDVVGFASGTVNVNASYKRFFLRRGALGGLLALPRLMRPSLARKAWETTRYPSDVPADLPQAEWLTLGVDPSARGGGIGRELARTIVDELGRRGASRAKLVVAADNEVANHLYERMGYTRETTLALHEGQMSYIWTFSCPSS